MGSGEISVRLSDMSILKPKTKFGGDCAEMRELAARICRDYLNGAWKSVSAKTIGFKHVSGGLSNLLYHVSLPEHLRDDTKADNGPQEVLIRVYGQTHGERALEALITDSVIFTLLSERGLGPKLHGIFPGGRIEQYINARPLLTREMADPQLTVQIAHKMATIHSMEVPLHKEPRWLWDTIDRWLTTCEAKFTNSGWPGEIQTVVPGFDYRTEIKWMRARLEELNPSVVFCHNDMQEGNILMSLDEPGNTSNNNEDEEKKVIIIDFEYCSYNYRAFDIANHFIEWVYDYTPADFPYFKETFANYPTEKQRLRFVNAYLEESNLDLCPKKLLREVEVFTLASHMFWSLWSFVNLNTSQIPFGYIEYGCNRLMRYVQLKQRLMNGQVKRKVDSLE